MRYFKKIYPRQPHILSNGRGFTFPALQSGVGAHATENPVLIKEFETAIAAKVGGIEEITAQEYEDLKKKAPPRNHNEALSPTKLAQIKIAADRAAAERAARPTQLTPVSRSFKTPAGSGRLNSNSYRPGTVDRK